MDDFASQLQFEIKSVFDRVDTELIPLQAQRLHEINEISHQFIDVEAPLEIDKTSGEVSRQLKKAYEKFSIGQQKEKIRYLDHKNHLFCIQL